MKYGKRVCQSLKVVRKQIADANEIPYEITECTHQGNCPGTCPKCESELRYIENQLSLRRAAGKAISLVGLSLGISAVFTACGTNQESKQKDSQSSDAVNTIEVVEEGEEIIMTPIQQDTLAPLEKERGQVFTVVEQQPEFPGGEAALMAFIKKNLKYPASASESDIQGRVTLSFIVEKDGSIDNIEVLRSPAEELSKEAIRIVKQMPKWKPGKVHGDIVRVKYVLPITFRLQ